MKTVGKLTENISKTGKIAFYNQEKFKLSEESMRITKLKTHFKIRIFKYINTNA